MDTLSIVLTGVVVGLVLLVAMFTAGARLVMRGVNEQGEANFVMLAGGVTLLVVSSTAGAVVYQLLANTDFDIIEALAVGSVISALVVAVMILSLRIVKSAKSRSRSQKTP